MSRALPTWFLLFSLFLLYACNQDEPTGIGVDPLAGLGVEIQFTDELEIQATLIESEAPETGVLDNFIVVRPYILGAIDDDPVFGKSFAGAYMQFTPFDQITSASEFVVPAEELVFDSLILQVDYINIEAYGDTTSLQNWVVYEMVEQIDCFRLTSDQDYAINDSEELGRLTDFKLEPLEPFGEDSLDSRFRVDISGSDLGERLVEVLRDPLDSAFVRPDEFQELFNGLYIAPDTTQSNNSLASVNLASDATALQLFYRDLSIVNEDNQGQVLTFLISNDTCQVLNRFEHNYTTASDQSIADVLASDEKILDEYAYLQGHAGLQVELEFPDLADLGDILVNRADLVLTHVGSVASGDSTYVLPLNLDFRSPQVGIAFNQDDPLQYINDYAVFAEAIVEERDTLNTRVQTYTYNMNLWFQEMMAAPLEDRRLRISVSNLAPLMNDRLAFLPSEYMMNRLIVAGPNHPIPEFRLKVNLFYTEIEP